ncbi:MAG: hypothetical protein KBA02_00150 [Paludibacteraceae bacterium]|nr:hypothetical protein [Paludibacteraceae bacterium]
MKAREKVNNLHRRLCNNEIILTIDEVEQLRRIEQILHRWCEAECGSEGYGCSWAIERDETTQKPFKVIYYHNGSTNRYKIADRETGALKKLRQICEKNNLSWYYQTDPRGCAVYVSKNVLTDSDYTNGVAICD